MGLSIDLDPTTDDQVGPFGGTGFQIEIATLRPFDAVFVKAAKPFAGAIGGDGVGRRNIQRHPAEIRGEESWPATVAGIVIFADVLWFKAAAVHQATGDSARATKGNEES